MPKAGHFIHYEQTLPLFLLHVLERIGGHVDDQPENVLELLAHREDRRNQRQDDILTCLEIGQSDTGSFEYLAQGRYIEPLRLFEQGREDIAQRVLACVLQCRRRARDHAVKCGVLLHGVKEQLERFVALRFLLAGLGAKDAVALDDQ